LAAALLAPAACTGASPAPKGWQPVAGQSNTWTNGSTTNRQEYSFDQGAFGGALNDLASRVTIDSLMRYRGARLQGSVPFAPCPGAAGVATFRLTGGATLQAGFAVRNGRAVRTSYFRPTGTPVDTNVVRAMQTSLCAL
jgi:hypothetical protein